MTTEKRNLTFTSDPGHGWLSVSLKDLKTLDLVDKISSYSYMTTTRAYLEEDQDASIFLKAAKEKGWEIKTKESTVESTPIRYYASYNPEKIELALSLATGDSFMMYNKSKNEWSTKANVVDITANKIFVETEFGAKYEISKTKLLSYIKPIVEEPTVKLKM